MGEKFRYTPDRARLALAVGERDAAFGRGVEFEDARDAEALLEVLPDLAAQAIAAGQPDAVRDRLPCLGRVREIAAELADILDDGAVAFGDIAPEAAGRETFADHHRASRHQHRADGHDSADRMIHRQA